ncbi:MAG: hypothetical protein ABUL43_00095 [Hyphomicrobium sp.]
MSISAAPLGPNIWYFDSTEVGARGHLDVHHEEEELRDAATARLRRNMTQFVEIIIPRQSIEKVFLLAQMP